MDSIDIRIKEVSKHESKNLQSSQLSIEISGTSANEVLVNTLRRLAYDYVPTYGFPSELITIEKNNSIFDNDYMRLRLSEMTIPKIENKVYYLEDKYWRDIDFSNPNRDKHPDDNKVLEFYINVTNDTKELLNVTTEHAKVFENGIELKDKFDHKYPLLIIQLRPDTSFNCRCVAALSIGKNNHIFCAAGNAYFDEPDPGKFILTLESQGQMSEYEILYKSCLVLKEKLKQTRELVKSKEFTGNSLKLELKNEDHTLGYLLNDFLQSNKEILYAGIAKPNLLVDTMILTMATVSKKSPLVVVQETIDHIVKLFDNIQNQIKKLGNIK
ncbi:DNA directed RNA polymerase subunit L [Indivirus ILV1]|uniref:DNA directed RNA polymerase subunit L n=1 Tax=Indivirus ILV1 TaxID=1977633 RepID=A0A1V0SCI2_9VIRU|nr:DNA directed RNA polymerase subunit L [Indivirus ILV1]